jgi:hypothetical protein
MHYYPAADFGTWLGAMADCITILGFFALML